MKHWFVEWLEQQAEHETTDKKSLYHRWAQLAEDMVRLGLEDVALRYYDAKQQGAGLSPRPHKQTEWKLDGILPQLERKLNMTYDPKEKELLQEIYTTLKELLETGMQQTAVTYYLRILAKHQTLRLKEPVMIVQEV